MITHIVEKATKKIFRLECALGNSDIRRYHGGKPADAFFTDPKTRTTYIAAPDVFSALAKFISHEVRDSTGRWQDDLATDKQISYLRSLGVRIEPRMTKGRASELIDAAKNQTLGSVSGFYTDGSN